MCTREGDQGLTDQPVLFYRVSLTLRKFAVGAVRLR